MELRSGRCLVPRQGGVRRGRAGHRADGDGGGEDRISALPDEVLLQRRWRGLWTELHLLTMAFRGAEPGTLRDLLSRGRGPERGRLVIHVPGRDGRQVAAAEVSSLLRAAVNHSPVELTVVLGGGIEDDHLPFELPRFTTATSMELQIWRRGFTLPPDGEFTRLERLALSLCCVDPSAFLHRFPRLRKLVMDCYWEMDAAAIRSESLEDVLLKDLPLADAGGTTRRVDVVAPLLKKFRLLSCGNRDWVVKFSESNVENLSFKYCSISSCSVGLACWRLKSLDMAMESSSEQGHVVDNLVHVLSLVIIIFDGNPSVNRSFAEEIACLPVNNFSVLKLEVPQLERFTGPLVLHLLNTLNVVQRLQLVLSRYTASLAGLLARIKVDDEDISFPELEEIEIEGFGVTPHQLHFLEVLFKSAPVLKIVRIKLSSGVSQSHPGYKELCGIFQANASVQSFVNGSLQQCEDNLPQAPSSHVGGIIGC
ncbi:hypothetical protein C2845_PM06G10990 [Panicum miliaceum]|uniref:FBD domain-containing protein n=1 Tax=Panicum miliaceum TaxID=4540 RepID=A0A3L6R6F4_PANMI|nr:hypothetical protein C2845_PM06G10990 [Panicum miliaceum]